MKIFHRIAFNNLQKPELVDLLNNFAVQYKITNAGGSKENFLVSFTICEDDSKWETIKYITSGFLDMIYTEFTTDEVLASEWIRIIPYFEIGYPAPKNSFSKEDIYTDICERCGIGYQNSLIRITKTPNLRGNMFFTLIGLRELFCTKEVLEVFNLRNVSGYEAKDVILYDSNEPSTLLKQLFINNSANAGLIEEELLNPGQCPLCGIVKFKPHVRGPMKFNRLAFDKNRNDFLLTNEWFGSGHFAFRDTLISNKVAKIIVEHGWKGAKLEPIELF